MTNPFPFTAGDVLNAADLNAIGEVEDYTPNFTNGITVGDGTLTGKYARLNDVVFAWGQFRLGSTSAVTGDVKVDVPVTASSTGLRTAVSTHVLLVDLSAGVRYAGIGRDSTASNVGLRYVKQSTGSSAANTANALSATLPFTWTANDSIAWTHVYMVDE